MEAVFSMVRKICGKPPGDPMEDLSVNLALRTAVHLGEDSDTKRHYAKNHIWDSLGQLVGEKKRLSCEQSEILGSKTQQIVGLKLIEFEDTT